MIFHLNATRYNMKSILTWFSTPCGSKLHCRARGMRFFFFQFKRALNVVRRHYVWDFNLIFHLKLETAQNLVGQQHERDFHMIFHFKKSQKISCRALWRKFWHEFPLYGASNLDYRALKKRFWHYFSLYGGSKRGCRALWKRMGDWPNSYDNEQKWVQFSWFSSWQFHQKEG